MKCTSSTILVSNALIWAAAIIAMSLLFKGAENSQNALFILIATWYASHMLIERQNRTEHQSNKCTGLVNYFKNND